MPRKKRPSNGTQEPAGHLHEAKSNDGNLSAHPKSVEQTRPGAPLSTVDSNASDIANLKAQSEIAINRLDTLAKVSTVAAFAKGSLEAGRPLEEPAATEMHWNDPEAHQFYAEPQSDSAHPEEPAETAKQALPRPTVQDSWRTAAVGYLFWAGCFAGICGLHRLVAGKWATGLLWLVTVGLCGIGQVIDLFLMKKLFDSDAENA